MALFDIRGLSFRYPNNEKNTLDRLDFSIEHGEFVTLIGATGSGKSTLLRLLKPELQQNGEVSGEILFHGKPLRELTAKESAMKIGFVAQSPEEQIVTDKVWHELAFTLENLGAKQGEIARRVAETAAYFGIAPWYRQATATLSGGQKQLLNLAAVMTAEPEALILDEPTAQLDPITAARFIDTLYKLNRETGVTVIISEHRAEELLPICDRLMILDSGRLIADGTAREIAGELQADSPYLQYLPCAARIYRLGGGTGECPLSVREGQRYFRENHKENIEPEEVRATEDRELALEVKDAFFRYEKAAPDVLRGLSLSVNQGEIFALLGANGCGKSTAAAVIAGLLKPYAGKVKLFGKRLKEYKNGSLYSGNLSLLPQDAESVFLRATVREELAGCEAVLEKMPFDLSPLYDRHPYDLSGGERQLVALCKALSTEPRLLILDEPSKGLDPIAKQRLADLLKTLKAQGMTILLVSHDVEFAAICADRCALFFDGAVAACDNVGDFMNGNRYYTTAASRITRGCCLDAYTAERAAILLRGGERE